MCPSNNTLAYTKTGRKVTVIGELIMSAVSSPLGNLTINLPFASRTGGELAARAHFNIACTTLAIAQSGQIFSYPTNGSINANIRDGGGLTSTENSDFANHIGSASRLLVEMTYFTA